MLVSLLQVSTLLAAVASAARMEPRDSKAEFQAYAYGDNIGGLTLFSAGGNVYIGDYSAFDDTQAAPIVFTPNGETWQASPNTTGLASTDDPTWSDYTFAIPSTSSSSDSVAILDSSEKDSSSYITDCFTFYGTVIFATGTAGNMESHWYAVATGTDGIYSLKWNNAKTDGLLITLKKTAPSSA